MSNNQLNSSGLNFNVDGMACDGCAATVEKTASAFAGVEEATINFETKILTVKGSPNVESLKLAVKEAGYTLTEQ